MRCQQCESNPNHEPAGSPDGGRFAPSDAIALASPSGSMSQRAKSAAQERIRQELFGKTGLSRPTMQQPATADALRRQASELRQLAARGMNPRAYTKKAEELENRASKLEQKNESDMQEKTPFGFEHIVKALKGKVDNPWAVVNAMKNKGIRPKRENGEPYDPHALYRRYQYESALGEAQDMSAVGQLARKGVREGPFGTDPSATFEAEKSIKTESIKPAMGRLGWVTPFRETMATKKDDVTAGIPSVVLISAGCGNIRDGNVYPPEVVAAAAPVFEGKPCYQNHSGTLDSENRPEREIELILGWWKNVHVEDIDGQTSLVANLQYMADLDGNLTESGKMAKGLIESAIRYQREYPQGDKTILGFSIDASGPSTSVPTEKLAERYPQFKEALEAREHWNCVDAIEEARSCDAVTLPARGGRVRGLTKQQESKRWRIDFKKVIESKQWRERFSDKLSE